MLELKNGKFFIDKILKDGPLYRLRDKVSIGDQLTAIDDVVLEEGKNIWITLNGKMSKRIKLTFETKNSQKPVNVFIKPISAGAENRLRLVEWVEECREQVKEKTKDQVAYLYMSAMGMGNLTRFLRELERDAFPRKAVILDLRNNFGGNVHDRVLQALTQPVYAKWQVRGMSETPQSTYGLSNKPVVLITNEVTLSDGEMTANGFKALKRGPIVGNTTYGWLIFTTSARLMNGGSFRLPFWGCFTLDGQDLETIGGVKPDILVINDLNHDILGQDPQLDKAIETALKLIKE
ncbi:S41 family peptidase [Acidobacteriota bacterium]